MAFIRNRIKRLRLPPGKTIRERLLIGFVLVAVLPAVAISIGSTITGVVYFRQKSIEQLESLIVLKEMNVDMWVEAGQNELALSLNEMYVLERLMVVSKPDLKNDYYYYNKNMAVYRLNRYLSNAKLLKSLSFLDPNGQVLLSTDPGKDGRLYGSQRYFQTGLQKLSTWVIPDPQTGAPNQVIVVGPVRNPDKQVIGELVGEIRQDSLATILGDPIIKGNQARSYLVDTGFTLYDASPSSPLLASGSDPGHLNVHSRGIDTVIANKDSGYLTYADYRGVGVLGIYQWIPELNMALLVEQDMASVLKDIFTNQVLNLTIILIGITLAVVISILTSRQIAGPLMNLSQATAKIASGDLERTVEVEQEDEIGTLARSFNSMTAQIRGLVNDLEQRVKDRTGELQESNQQLTRRARQMELTAQVSREITSILDLDGLLSGVVHLIRASFGYYHVSIFLLDPLSNALVWRAGTDTVSPQTLVLPPDKASINIRAVQGNTAVLIPDVLLEASYLADETLPDARSELVIPLRMGEKVIGTMDVYHTDAGAFSQEDLTVLQGLGDQIAIAINNALLYERIQKLAVLEERNRMARELHDSISQLLYSQVLYADASQKYLSVGQPEKIPEYVEQLQESAHQALKEMRLMIYELRPSILETEGLWGAIRHRLEMVEQRSGLEAELRGDPALKIPAEVEKDLYLIAQEALNNVLKHSRATRVEVYLGAEDGNIVLSVLDYGVGFTTATAKAGLGLNNIREHTERLGGSLALESTPGRGTRVTICIPGESHHG